MRVGRWIRAVNPGRLNGALTAHRPDARLWPLVRLIGKQESSHCPGDSAGLYDCRADQGLEHSACDGALICEIGVRCYKANIDSHRVENQPNYCSVEYYKQSTNDEKHIPTLLFLPYGRVKA